MIFVAQRKQFISITKTKKLTLFRKINTGYSETHDTII